MLIRTPKLATRRDLIKSAAGLWLANALVGSQPSRANQPPDSTQNHDPRVISGDRSEPAWDELLTISVGRKDADLVGSNEKVLQAAIDYIAQRGGGTVRIQPGTYRLRNAIYLPSRVRLVGSGPESILIKEPSVSTTLAANADWYDQMITLTDTHGFQVGDGICLRGKNPHNGGDTVIKRTLVARSGNRFKLDRALRENLWIGGQPTAASLFPILTSENSSNIVIENLVLDGNKSNNENLNGNYAGCIWLQDCTDIKIRGVTARNYNGDGMSWQICHDVLVENCHSHDNQGLGFHPGSGSQRPVIRSNRSERNQIGIFFCWGVRFGLAEENTIIGARESGISIGHRDTDNLVRKNAITSSGQVGILFRDETEAFGGHRNRCEQNTIVDSGAENGIGIDVRGQTVRVELARNEVRETRPPASRVGIRIGPKAREITLEDNQISGYSTKIADLRNQG